MFVASGVSIVVESCYSLVTTCRDTVTEDLVSLVSHLSVYSPESVSESGGRTMERFSFLLSFKERLSI